MLYLVGKNISRQKAHELKRLGRIERLADGVYCSSEDLAGGTEATSDFLERHALRISTYFYPNCALSHASAYRRGPIAAPPEKEGGERTLRLFVAGKRLEQKTIGALTIVRSDDMKGVANEITFLGLDTADGLEADLGPVEIACAVDELIYLQMFGRRRSFAERYLSEEQLAELGAKLIRQYGQENLGTRLKILARAVPSVAKSLSKAMEHVELIARRAQKPAVEDAARKPTQVFAVGWHGRHIADLGFDGMEFRFDLREGWLLPLSHQPTPLGRIPRFILNLFPEGVQQTVLTGRETIEGVSDVLGILKNSKRYIGNVAILDGDPATLASLPEDAIHGSLSDYTERGIFKGTLYGLPMEDPTWLQKVQAMFADPEMPRISGTQVKVPMFLDEKGVLSPAVGKPFSHILKLPNNQNDPYGAKGVLEWLGMRMSAAGGLEVPGFCLIDFGAPHMGLAYLTERFDVRRGAQDYRSIFAEDMCSVLNRISRSKAPFEPLEALVGSLKEISTDPIADMEGVLRMVLVGWLIENGDLHLKNISVLKIASPMLDRFRSVRLAPAYDMMNTVFFRPMPLPAGALETMTVSINGKNHSLTYADFIEFAQKIGVDADRAHAIVIETTEGVLAEAGQLALEPIPVPVAYPYRDRVLEIATITCERARAQCTRLLAQAPEPAAGHTHTPQHEFANAMVMP
jgi:serine/threonine-protein kinase HipA